jgi:hypothetical protein
MSPLMYLVSVQMADPQTGKWEKPLIVRSDDQGSLTFSSFPDWQSTAVTDWALKIKKH